MSDRDGFAKEALLQAYTNTTTFETSKSDPYFQLNSKKQHVSMSGVKRSIANTRRWESEESGRKYLEPPTWIYYR